MLEGILIPWLVRQVLLFLKQMCIQSMLHLVRLIQFEQLEFLQLLLAAFRSHSNYAYKE